MSGNDCICNNPAYLCGIKSHNKSIMDFKAILENNARKAIFDAWLAYRRLEIYEWLISEPRNASCLMAFEFVAQIPDKPLPKNFSPEEQKEYAAFFDDSPVDLNKQR